MDSVDNLFTYGLLLYHGLSEKKAKQMALALEKLEHLNARTFHGKYLDKFNKTEWPAIDTFIKNPQYIIDYAKYYIGELEEWFNFGDLEVKDFIVKNIKPDIDSCGISWGLISDTIKKHMIQKWLYYSIAGAYEDLPLKVKEVKFGSEKFNSALLRSEDSESMPTKSKSNVEALKKFFIKEHEKYLPVYKEVFKYPPLKNLKDIPYLNTKNFHTFFKSQLAIELKHVLQPAELNDYNRDIIIGYCLSIAGYCKDYKTYIIDDKFETMNTSIEEQAFIDEYKRNLRDCARNALK
ncbi:MAG: hypothetical protein K9J30_14115 [Bacteroidales bacterium]|nr:hypothetical protein [Bacteroidales bacterium]